MAIPESVASAAAAFAFNANMLERGFKNVTEEQWLELPSGANNNLLWIVGHIVLGALVDDSLSRCRRGQDRGWASLLAQQRRRMARGATHGERNDRRVGRLARRVLAAAFEECVRGEDERAKLPLPLPRNCHRALTER